MRRGAVSFRPPPGPCSGGSLPSTEASPSSTLVWGRPPHSGSIAGTLLAPSPWRSQSYSPTASTPPCPWRARSAPGSLCSPFGIASAQPPQMTSPPSAPSLSGFTSATRSTPIDCGGEPRKLSVPAQSTE
jgi:hypothetical protein